MREYRSSSTCRLNVSTILWMSCGRRRFLLSVLHEALGSVDHKDADAAGGVLLVEHNDAGRDAGAIEEVGRQADDALDVAARQQLLADGGLGVAAEEDAVRHNDRCLAGALQGLKHVQQERIVAVLLGGRPNSKRP